MHTKATVFGGQVAIVGSWNCDNRSASLNSENVAVCGDARVAAQLEAVIADDMRPEVADEITLDQVSKLSPATEVESTLLSLLGDVL